MQNHDLSDLTERLPCYYLTHGPNVLAFPLDDYLPADPCQVSSSATSDASFISDPARFHDTLMQPALDAKRKLDGETIAKHRQIFSHLKAIGTIVVKFSSDPSRARAEGICARARIIARRRRPERVSIKRFAVVGDAGEICIDLRRPFGSELDYLLSTTADDPANYMLPTGLQIGLGTTAV